jgi:hypothetical protein
MACRFDSGQSHQSCLGGVMVATLVLEASGEIRVSSSLTRGTKFMERSSIG